MTLGFGGVNFTTGRSPLSTMVPVGVPAGQDGHLWLFCSPRSVTKWSQNAPPDIFKLPRF